MGGGEPSSPAPGKPAAVRPPGPKITISRETTFVTGPLRPDGRVDYRAAINERYSKGVTPDNNAAVPLLQAFGPRDIEKDVREQFFKKLGIAPLPAEGGYFIQVRDFARHKHRKARQGETEQEKMEALRSKAPKEEDVVNQAFEQWLQAMERPWSKEEFPVVAEWLERNSKQIGLMAEASRRTRFYVPMVCSGEPDLFIKEAIWPMIQIAREAARTLITRAMLNVKAGKVDEAWADLLACHRLARLFSQGATLVERLVALGVEAQTQAADVALVSYGHLSAEEATRLANDLRSLPPMAPFAESVNHTERYLYLECVLLVARDGPIAGLRRFFGDPNDAKTPTANTPLGDPVWRGPVDWDEALRIGNASFDRIYEGFTSPTPAQRRAAIEQLERDRIRMETEAQDPKWKAENLRAAPSPSVAAGRQIARFLLSWFSPSPSFYATWEDRAMAHRIMDPLLFALAAYRAEQGEYPAELAGLCPKYVKSLPADPFGTGPIRYKREPPGYVLYSVGPNGRDDGGRNWNLESNPNLPEDQQPKIPQDSDDFFIRVPSKGE
jgi:hypothetical protein